MTTATPRHINLDRLKLGTGAHQPANLDNGVADQGAACLLECAAFMAGEPWTDHPECVSPVLGAYGRSLNDVLPDDRRQELVPLIPQLIGTAGDGKDERRSYMALDWLIRTYTPTFLRLVPSLVESSDMLAGLPEIVDLESARAAGLVVKDAATKADAAWDAAWAAAGDAAWAAARAAAGDAAWAAARAAAGAAAWAAARAAAAGDAAWDAAGDAAWAAAGAAAGAAAWAAARAAARAAAWAAAWDAAWDAAWAAARAALAPTVMELQSSAIALFQRLIAP